MLPKMLLQLHFSWLRRCPREASSWPAPVVMTVGSGMSKPCPFAMPWASHIEMGELQCSLLLLPDAHVLWTRVEPEILPNPLTTPLSCLFSSPSYAWWQPPWDSDLRGLASLLSQTCESVESTQSSFWRVHSGSLNVSCDQKVRRGGWNVLRHLC